MPWIRLQAEYPRHRKTLRLVKLLGRIAELYPLHLWLWAVEQSPHGSLKDVDAEELALIVGHEGNADELWKAMAQAGFIEKTRGGWSIRSWDDHNGVLRERLDRNAASKRQARERRAGDGSATDEGRTKDGSATAKPTYVRTYVKNHHDGAPKADKSTPPEHEPTPQQRIVFEAVGLYEAMDLVPPSAGQIVRWAKLAGSPERLAALLDDLATTGKLGKGEGYVAACVKNIESETKEKALSDQSPFQPQLDGKRYPNHLRHSSYFGRGVPEDEWHPMAELIAARGPLQESA